MIDRALLAAARLARARAYAPYSRFKVGAAVRDERGRIHVGCNVENAAYPEGICAETAAIAEMVLKGGKRIAAIAIFGGGPELITPCGGCRQRIREFASQATPIDVQSGRRAAHRFTLEELLPHAFGPIFLKGR